MAWRLVKHPGNFMFLPFTTFNVKIGKMIQIFSRFYHFVSCWRHRRHLRNSIGQCQRGVLRRHGNAVQDLPHRDDLRDSGHHALCVPIRGPPSARSVGCVLSQQFLQSVLTRYRPHSAWTRLANRQL